MNCIFCKIINNEIPNHTIYEDDLVKVFLDIKPSTNGDCLVVPKKHYENIFTIPDDLILHIHNTSKKIFNLLKEKLQVKGLTLVQNNEHGQEIKHYHLHLTPRYTNDNLNHQYNKEALKELEEIFSTIKN